MVFPKLSPSEVRRREEGADEVKVYRGVKMHNQPWKVTFVDHHSLSRNQTGYSGYSSNRIQYLFCLRVPAKIRRPPATGCLSSLSQ
jgi:hypothetical protein